MFPTGQEWTGHLRKGGCDSAAVMLRFGESWPGQVRGRKANGQKSGRVWEDAFLVYFLRVQPTNHVILSTTSATIPHSTSPRLKGPSLPHPLRGADLSFASDDANHSYRHPVKVESIDHLEDTLHLAGESCRSSAGRGSTWTCPIHSSFAHPGGNLGKGRNEKR
jgi:hypothetical protein